MFEKKRKPFCQNRQKLKLQKLKLIFLMMMVMNPGILRRTMLPLRISLLIHLFLEMSRRRATMMMTRLSFLVHRLFRTCRPTMKALLKMMEKMRMMLLPSLVAVMDSSAMMSLLVPTRHHLPSALMRPRRTCLRWSVPRSTRVLLIQLLVWYVCLSLLWVFCGKFTPLKNTEITSRRCLFHVLFNRILETSTTPPAQDELMRLIGECGLENNLKNDKCYLTPDTIKLPHLPKPKWMSGTETELHLASPPIIGLQATRLS